MDLKGKVALVTGGGRGLGYAYAVALCAAGASVVLNDVDEGLLEKAVEELSRSGAEVAARAGAVGGSEVADDLVAVAVERFGKLDVLVSNAGVLRDKVLWKMTDEDFDTVIAVHLRGTFTCARAAAAAMREQDGGGRIILAGSPAGQRGNFGQTNYAAAKAGIAAMARTWAMELARSQITVNAIIPTAATEMTKTVPVLAPFAKALERGEEIPARVRRAAAFGTAADAAPLVVFLASDAAASITGQCIGIGGDRLSLWSHPAEVKVAFRDGGWSSEAITEAWSSTVGSVPETYGIALPDLAAE